METPHAAAEAQEQVQQKARDAREQAGARLREQVDRRSTDVAEQIDSFVHALRRSAEQLQEEDKQGPAKLAGQAADQVERLGGYLRDCDSDRLLADAERFARQRPWVAGGLGAVGGFLASRFLKASSSDRYDRTRSARVDADAPISREREQLRGPEPYERPIIPPGGMLPPHDDGAI